VISGQLSSDLTIPYKYVFAPLWIGGFSLGTIALLTSGEPQGWLFLVATLAGSTYLYFKFSRVRHVVLVGDVFHISDYGRHRQVHVSQLRSVEASRWSNPETVVLYFRTDTGFGDNVVFIARLRWLAGFGEHPVADELRRLAKRQSPR
jgi:hypothetical protein